MKTTTIVAALIRRPASNPCPAPIPNNAEDRLTTASWIPRLPGVIFKKIENPANKLTSNADSKDTENPKER